MGKRIPLLVNLLLLVWFSASAAMSYAEQPLSVNGQRQLFVDDYLIESIGGLQRTLGAVQKSSSNPVVPRSEPWEAARAELYGSAIWNSQQQRYELFYSAMHQPYDSRLAVAYSTDAVQWTKPELNLYPFQGDATTNIVYVLPQDDPGIQGQYAHMGAWVHGPSVIYDAHDSDGSRRYKMITNAGNG